MLSSRYISDVCKQKQTILLQIIIFNAVTIYWHCNMPFSNGDKALINDVHQFKKYCCQRIMVAVLKTYCKGKNWAC